jgi:PAS domain S-box-containing protein
MTERHQVLSRNHDEDAALRMILEGTARETGEEFFRALVENLARALGTAAAWVTEFIPEHQRLRAIAFWLDGEWIDEYEYRITGTPCESVVVSAEPVYVQDNVIDAYPDDLDLRKFNFASYYGVPLCDVDGTVLGHLAVHDSEPLEMDARIEAIMQIFSARAAAELQRHRAETGIREREEKLRALVNSAMDAIIELDDEYRITMLNGAAEVLFKCKSDAIRGESIGRLLDDESRGRFSRLASELGRDGGTSLWMPGGLRARCLDDTEFPAEATLSRYELGRSTYYTIILRNTAERVQAEQRIRALASEAEYLKDEIRALAYFDELLGDSGVMRQVTQQIAEVAHTDATVLIFGETGTGKGLVARAIHAESGRREAPFINVNCAAVPASLIESEFFGHEKGAFTGATQRRDGRFTLADGGTIFLDEIGDLPLDLQAKLLRVVQDGAFEPVGSSHTRMVDVRVIAATNHDLEKAVAHGTFREDLYYRLNVFPIEVPPLRDRGDDVVVLASAFAEECAHRMGRELEPLTPDCMRRLKGYEWPGNVRELANVIERAVITSRDRRLNLDRALPPTDAAPPIASAPKPADRRVITMDELRELERDNLLRALEETGWKVSGDEGAARLLGMKPSTLTSRMKALGVQRPRSQ